MKPRHEKCQCNLLVSSPQNTSRLLVLGASLQVSSAPALSLPLSRLSAADPVRQDRLRGHRQDERHLRRQRQEEGEEEEGGPGGGDERGKEAGGGEQILSIIRLAHVVNTSSPIG